MPYSIYKESERQDPEKVADKKFIKSVSSKADVETFLKGKRQSDLWLYVVSELGEDGDYIEFTRGDDHQSWTL